MRERERLRSCVGGVRAWKAVEREAQHLPLSQPSLIFSISLSLSIHSAASRSGPTGSRASTSTRRSPGTREEREREKRENKTALARPQLALFSIHPIPILNPLSPSLIIAPPLPASRLLVNLYNGTVCIYSTADGSLLKSWEVTDLPVRAAAFVPRRQWVVTGADDCHVRVFNVHTLARERAFEAHADYIRAVTPHPSLPILLTASDDMTIKAWDWERGWACTQVRTEESCISLISLRPPPSPPRSHACLSLLSFSLS